MADSDYVKQPFVRGGGYAASLSATTPTSGVLDPYPGLNGFSGPWLIETQTLGIDYVRVPFNGLDVSSKTITLSGATLAYGYTHSTELVALIRGEYSRTIEYANYNTSSFQQTQQFEINAVGVDPNGVSYGSSALIGTSALGPMGSVLTVQPFYRRTPYNNETLVTSSVSLANFSLSADGNLGVVSTHQGEYLTDFEFWKDSGCTAGTQREGGDNPVKIQNGHTGLIFGAYSPASESPLFISNWIDLVAHGLTNSWHWTIPGNPNVPGNTLAGLPEYDKSRHQY